MGANGGERSLAGRRERRGRHERVRAEGWGGFGVRGLWTGSATVRINP